MFAAVEVLFSPPRSGCSEQWAAGSSGGEVFRLLDVAGSDTCATADAEQCDPAVMSGLAQHRREVEADLATRVARDTMVFKLGPDDQVLAQMDILTHYMYLK